MDILYYGEQAWNRKNAMNTNKLLFTQFLGISSALFGATDPQEPHLNELPEPAIQTIGQCLSNRDLGRFAKSARRIQQLVQADLDERLSQYWKNSVTMIFKVPLHIMDYDHDKKPICFSTKEDLIACAESGGFSLYDAATGQKVCRQTSDCEGAIALSFIKSDSAALKLAEITEAHIRTWRITKKEYKDKYKYDATVIDTIDIRTSYISRAASSSDGNAAVYYSTAWNLRVWTKDGMHEASTNEFDSAITALSFSGDGKLLAIGTHRGSVYVWNLETDEKVKMKGLLRGGTARVSSVLFSHGQKYLAAGFKSTKKDYVGGYYVLDLITNQMVKTDESLDVASLAFSPDDKIIAVGIASEKDRGTISLVNFSAQRQLNTVPCKRANSYVKCLAFSPDGKSIAAVTSDGYFVLWRTGTEPKERDEHK